MMRQAADEGFPGRVRLGRCQRSTPLPGDASTRHYARLALNGRKAMLMDQPQAAEAPAAPADAERGGAPRAGLQCRGAAGGRRLRPLRRRGRHVCAAMAWRRRKFMPPIAPAAFVILEDLGDALFADVLADGGDETELYQPRWRCWRSSMPDAPAALSADKPLYDYDETALLAETDLLTEWFLPLALGRAAHGRGSGRASRACGARRWQGSARPPRASCIATIMPRTCSGCRSAGRWPGSA